MDDLENQQGLEVTGDNGTETPDYSQFGVEPETPEQPVVTGQAEVIQDGDNPKWAPFLEAIPAPFHGPVKEQLRKWDQGVNQRFQELQAAQKEWEPFKPFKDQGVDPARLQQSFEVANRLARDPLTFYNDLRNSLIQRGYMKEEAPASTAPVVVPPDPDDPYFQQLTALEQKIADRDKQLAEYFNHQQQEQREQQFLAEETSRIEQDFAAIEAKAGKLSEPLKAMIVEKALVLGQQTKQVVSIQQAAVEVFRVLNAARNVKPAPRGIPTGGGIPHTPVPDAGEMSKEERFRAAQAIAQRYANSD